MGRQVTRSRFSKRLKSTTILAGLLSPLLCAPGFAQDQDAVEDDEEEIREVILITGSRIAKPDFAFTNPVLSVSSEAIKLSGTTNLTDFLREIPALTNSFGLAVSDDFIGTTGLNLLDLRNLGTDRTLVLVDGRRHVSSSSGTSAVDTNTIPVDLVERVEVLTGGASALYGADGVSGVVNFILKKDFEGISARGQAGISDEGDADTQLLNVTWGQNFANGRGNFALSFEYNRSSRLEGIDRDFADGPNRFTFQQNPADVFADGTPDDPNVPDEIPLLDMRFFDSARNGAIDADFDFSPDFEGDGDPFDFGTVFDTPAGPTQFVPPFFQQGGSGTPRQNFIGDLLPSQRSFTTNALLSYEVAPWANFFAEFKYVDSEAIAFSQPTFDFFLAIEPDNPFIPQNILDFANDAGSPLILISRDHFDLGVRGDNIDRRTIRSVIGFEGEMDSGIRWEISYVYGENKATDNVLNNRFEDRFAAALDVVTDPATGDPVCRSNLDPSAIPFNVDWLGFPEPTTFTPGPGSGCLPINLFGEGVTDPEAIAFVFNTTVDIVELKQHVVSGYVSGDAGSFFELPGGAPSWAVGGEYRRESSFSDFDDITEAGLTFGNAIPPEQGSFEVIEGFAEIDLPILRDRPLVNDFTVDAAVRISDYTTIGTTTTWKVGAVWSPVEDIRFRGTYSRAVRAPNIGELFDPGGQDFEFIDDPCDADNQNEGTQFRAANCATILSAFGVDPTTFNDPNSASIPGIQRGNPDLTEETAKSFTLGVVLQPTAVPGLTVSLDWYDIEIQNAVNFASAEELAELCVDAPTLDPGINGFCALIVRDPTTGGIIDFTQIPQNVAQITTAGLDVQINYSLDPADWGIDSDIGTFDFRLIGNYLDELTFIPLPGAPVESDVGEADIGSSDIAPEYQITLDLTWNKGPFTVNYGFNYFSRLLRFEPEEIAGDPDIADPEFIKLGARRTHDIQIDYEVNEFVSVYAGVNNLFDQEPSLGVLELPVSPVGRFLYIGFRTNFNVL